MKKVFAVVGFAAPVAVLILASCAPLPHDPKETYILVTGDINLPYWQTMLQGLNHAASELKVKAEIDGPENYDPQAVNEALQKAIKRKPSGILLWALDPNLMTPGINEAEAQGIPVITVNADAPQSKRSFFVGTDNYKSGRLVGRLAIDLLKNKGNIVVFQTSAPVNAKLRLDGLRDAISDHIGIKITQVVDLKSDPTSMFDTTQRLLQTNESISAFICLSATAGPEIGEVVKRRHMSGKIAVIATDADPRTLDLIEKGAVSASVAQKPYSMGYIGLMALDDLHHHPRKPLTGDWAHEPFSPIPAFIDTGVFVVDKGNVATIRPKAGS